MPSQGKNCPNDQEDAFVSTPAEAPCATGGVVCPTFEAAAVALGAVGTGTIERGAAGSQYAMLSPSSELLGELSAIALPSRLCESTGGMADSSSPASRVLSGNIAEPEAGVPMGSANVPPSSGTCSHDGASTSPAANRAATRPHS